MSILHVHLRAPRRQFDSGQLLHLLFHFPLAPAIHKRNITRMLYSWQNIATNDSSIAVTMITNTELKLIKKDMNLLQILGSSLHNIAVGQGVELWGHLIALEAFAAKIHDCNSSSNWQLYWQKEKDKQVNTTQAVNLQGIAPWKSTLLPNSHSVYSLQESSQLFPLSIKRSSTDSHTLPCCLFVSFSCTPSTLCPLSHPHTHSAAKGKRRWSYV